MEDKSTQPGMNPINNSMFTRELCKQLINTHLKKNHARNVRIGLRGYTWWIWNVK